MAFEEPPGVTPLAVFHPHVTPVGRTGRGFDFSVAPIEIAVGAERRLADEYDAAQKRGEVARVSDGRRFSKGEDLKPTVANIGLTNKQIHEARAVRSAARDA
jgi:hypothetical protein